LSSREAEATRIARIERIIGAAKRLGRRYYSLTGRPLGVTGEIAEWEAVRLLRLEPAPVRQEGYDAIRRSKSGRRIRLQIKSRSFDQAKPGQRLGQIRLDRRWDAALLVILDTKLNVVAIFEATRSAIERALRRPGSKARNERWDDMASTNSRVLPDRCGQKSTAVQSGCDNGSSSVSCASSIWLPWGGARVGACVFAFPLRRPSLESV
jgi:hypothetical protein